MAENKKKIKTSKAEFAQRIFTIQGWIVEGVQTSLILKQILAAGWCESKRHAERMLQKGRDEWTEVEEIKLEQKRQLKVLELQQIKRTLKDQYKGTPAGIRAMVYVDKEIIKLQGLAPATKLQLSTPKGQPLALTTVQQLSDQQFHELLKKVNEKAGTS